MKTSARQRSASKEKAATSFPSNKRRLEWILKQMLDSKGAFTLCVEDFSRPAYRRIIE